MKNHSLFSGLLIWRLKHVPNRSFVIFLSLVVGLLGGLAAIFLKNLVHYTEVFLSKGTDIHLVNYLNLVFPLLGLAMASLFLKWVIREDISHGISKLLLAISRKESLVRFHNTWSSMVASTLTVGFGGSAGLEAPVVLTGGAIGSRIGHVFHLNYKHRTLLIGCGAAAVISGIFKAPVAAVVFSVEVLMLDLTTFSLIPLLVSASAAASLSYFILGNDVVFSFTVSESFHLKNLPWYLVLGLMCGFFSLYVTKTALFIESGLGKIRNQWAKILVGGSVLSLLVFLFPPLFGEGYLGLKSILSGRADELANYSFFSGLKGQEADLLLYLAVIMVLKVIAMAFTTGAGGIGGIFAPTLFMGGILGFLCAKLINLAGGKLPEQNFSLVGMAGLMAGVMQAPLTAVFLIAEITGGYQLFLPLMFTSIVAFLTIHAFEPHSIYTKKLAKHGDLITHHKDKQVLTLLKLKKVLETDLATIRPEASLADLKVAIATSRRNLFPVVSNDGSLVGMVYFDHIRHVVFNPAYPDQTPVKDLMEPVLTWVEPREPMSRIMKKFQDFEAWNLPVLENGKYLGMISRSRIFNAYRKLVLDFSEE